ncbi:MAG: rhodanese-related sulfurtransferase [Janthinobacterium sp.]
MTYRSRVGKDQKQVSKELFLLLFYNARIDLNHWTHVKFIIDHIFLFSIVVLSGGALLWPVLTTRGKRASPLEVTQLINRGKSTLLDVRSSAEFDASHLRDAKNIPLADVSKRIAELGKIKTRSIVVICASGTRSASAASVLQKAGFEDVVCLDGGINAWQSAGLPVTKGNAPTAAANPISLNKGSK